MKRITRLSETEFIALSALLEAPAYGYDLIKRFTHVSRSQMYHALSKLRGLGLLEMSVEKTPDAPDRQMYSIQKRQRRKIQHLLQESMNQASEAAQMGLRQYYLGHDAAGRLQDVALKLLRASGTPFRALSE